MQQRIRNTNLQINSDTIGCALKTKREAYRWTGAHSKPLIERRVTTYETRRKCDAWGSLLWTLEVADRGEEYLK
jgi:hypothetical protein